MANIDMTNGAVVSRAYSDQGEHELLAVFQYEGDADEWAKAKAASDAAAGMGPTVMIRTCLYSGKSQSFRAPAKS